MRSGKSLAEKIREAKACCREAFKSASERGRDLLNGDWKVLLVRRDAESGKYVAKTLCCDEASA